MKNSHRIISLLAGRTLSCAILALSLTATLWAWSTARDKELADVRLRFQRQVVRATAEAEDHLRNCEATLKAARGLFAASETVVDADWRDFVETISLPEHNPAVHGLAFVQSVPSEALSDFVTAARREHPGFDVFPREVDAPPGDAARVIRYIEPVAPNRGALGLDVRARPNIREAMDYARDHNAPGMTPVLQLAQDHEEQPSVVIYLPIYTKGSHPSTVSERREQLVGWAAAPIHLRALALDVLADTLTPDVRFELIERTPDGTSTVVFDTHDRADGHTPHLALSERSRIFFGDREWELCFTGLDRLASRSHGVLATVTLVSGLTLSLLLFGVLRSLSRTRRVAERMAHDMTATLRESEGRFRAAVTATRQVYYDWDPGSDAVTLGGATREILGRDPASITSLDQWLELVHPEDRDAFNHENQRVVNTKEPFNLEYRIRRADGSYATVLDSGCFFQDAAGAVSRMIGFAMDITDRRRAEEERRQSDERFRMLFEKAGVPFLLFSEGRVIDCNEAAVRILGVAGKSAVIGLAPHQFSPEVQPDGRPSRSCAADAFARLEQQESTRFEWACRRQTGESFVVEVVLSTVTLGGARLALAGWHDLTEVRRAEQERRRLQRILQIAVDAMPQRVFWKDTSGAFLGCNKAFARDAGFEKVEEIVGKTDFNLAWRSHAHSYRADDFEVMAAGRPRVNFLEKTTNSSGAERYIRTSKIPLCDEGGRTIGILGTFEDITDERAAKEELRHACDAAEAANRAKSEFLANMSHEIRTPMTAMLGYADLLADNSQNPGERDACLATIRRNGEHLLAIINDILDLSKIEAGRMSVERIHCSPAGIVRDVVALMKPRAEAKGIRLESVFDSPLPRSIVSDPTRLRQILVNLVGNAVKFTEHGFVRIHVNFETATLERPARVRFDIVDSGIGMTPDVVAGLFRPFTQADSSMTRRFGGTGLGLTITHRLSELLGGEIRVVSKPRQGSTFTIRLPLGCSEIPKLIDPRLEPVEESGGESKATSTPTLDLAGHILLVEDGPDNQRLIAHILRAAGASVEIAENGQVAVDRLAQAPDSQCHLVLMDMQMPVLDGYSATRTLRARGFTGPIVALTAHAMAGERDRCLAAGCDDFATKPVMRGALLQLCARWMQTAKERADAT